MEKEKEREFDPALKKVYDAIKDASPGSLGSFASANESSISALQGGLDAAIGSLTQQAWIDSISAKISDSQSKITELLKNCTDPAHQILGKVGPNTTSLISALDNYNDTITKTNNEVAECNREIDVLNGMEQYKTTTTTDADGNTHTKTEERDEYTQQVNKINGIKGDLQTKDDLLKTWKETAEGYIAIIKGLLSPIGSEASNAAFNMSVGRTVSWDDIKPEDIDSKFKEGYTAEGTRTYDANGNLISCTYTIKDKDGNIIRSGTIHYDSDGKPTIVNYVEHYDKPTPKDEITQYAVKGDDTGYTAYFDDEIEAEKTEVESKTEYVGDTDGDGKENYEEKSHEKKEFTDGAKTDMNYETEGEAVVVQNEDGTTDVDKQPEVRDGKGTLTTAEGEVLDATTHEEWGIYGRKETEIDLKDQKTGDTVVDSTDTTFEVDDDKFGTGLLTEESSSVVDEASEDFITVYSGKTLSDSYDGDELYTEGYTAKVSKKDPNIVEMDIDDQYPNHKAVTHYNEEGKLIETETVDGDVVSETEVKDDHKVTLTLSYTDTRGEKQTKTVTYNMGTSYGCAQINTAMKDAQSDSGYWDIDAGRNIFWEGPCDNYEVGNVTVTVVFDPSAEITVPEAAATVKNK